MADNRLYLGNTRTKEWIYLSKSGIGKDYGWYDFEITDLIREFIDYDMGQFLGYSSELVFITEHDLINSSEWLKENEWQR